MLWGGLDDLFRHDRGQALAVSHAFYPSHVRKLTLQAGSDRKLTLTRQDGVGQEYLYVWESTSPTSSASNRHQNRPSSWSASALRR
jgi:hypothetical protein